MPLATLFKRSTPGYVRKSVHVVDDSDSDEYVANVDVREHVCAVTV